MTSRDLENRSMSTKFKRNLAPPKGKLDVNIELHAKNNQGSRANNGNTDERRMGGTRVRVITLLEIKPLSRTSITLLELTFNP